jgi:hypothetical protein
VVRPNWADGVKAAAEATRAETMMNFMVVVLGGKIENELKKQSTIKLISVKAAHSVKRRTIVACCLPATFLDEKFIQLTCPLPLIVLKPIFTEINMLHFFMKNLKGVSLKTKLMGY